jgi:hypothetical protein
MHLAQTERPLFFFGGPARPGAKNMRIASMALHVHRLQHGRPMWLCAPGPPGVWKSLRLDDAAGRHGRRLCSFREDRLRLG